MITTAKEYNEKLWLIEDANYPTQALLLPKDEFIYNVDLNSRIIQGPEFLGVEADHIAETIYFLVDRFFCGMDLANTSCLIQYTNARGDKRFFPVPYYDVYTYNTDNEEKKYIIAKVTYANYEKGKYYILDENNEYILSQESSFNPNITYYLYVDQPKILIPWSIGGEVTSEPGNIEYSLRFYIIDEDQLHYKYSLNTKTAISIVLDGLDTTTEQNQQYDADALSSINAKVDALARDYQLYWIEA